VKERKTPYLSVDPGERDARGNVKFGNKSLESSGRGRDFKKNRGPMLSPGVEGVLGGKEEKVAN